MLAADEFQHAVAGYVQSGMTAKDAGLKGMLVLPDACCAAARQPGGREPHPEARHAAKSPYFGTLT
jgi:hypothetical protein